MFVSIREKLVVAITSRALFNLDESHTIFEQDGIAAYQQYQILHENNILEQGPAFSLVKKLLGLHNPETEESLVEIILLSRNSAETGLRIFNSIKAYDLNITRAAFTNGQSPYRYIAAFGAHLFLSTHHQDVQQALKAQCAAATLLSAQNNHHDEGPLKIAFDGDAVLFSDEAEKVFQSQGLDAFKASESRAAKTPLQPGPFQGFLRALQNIQQLFPAETCPIRTALVTSRDAPAHERVIHTLRTWNIRTDEALFLGGLDKSEFLKAFDADIFFDDQMGHCNSTQLHVTTAHVPHGIMQEPKE